MRRAALMETCFSSLGRMVAFHVKRPWLGCCLQGSVLIDFDPCRLDHQSCKTRFSSPIFAGGGRFDFPMTDKSPMHSLSFV
jgi:hypothetical protein